MFNYVVGFVFLSKNNNVLTYIVTVLTIHHDYIDHTAQAVGVHICV